MRSMRVDAALAITHRSAVKGGVETTIERGHRGMYVREGDHVIVHAR